MLQFNLQRTGNFDSQVLTWLISYNGFLIKYIFKYVFKGEIRLIYVHITHKNNLLSIRKKGLLSGEKARKQKLGSDKNKISVFYLKEDVEKDILKEMRKAVYNQKIINPFNKNHKEEEYFAIKINNCEIEWNYIESPAEMYSPFIELSESFYQVFIGYAQTTKNIPLESLELLEI